MCVARQIDSQCHADPRSTHQRHEALVTSGFVSSPNYPLVYALTTDCWWTLTVQPTQTLRLTLYDFQLTVRTDRLCRDYLRITALTLTSSAPEVTVFEDCGSVGMQVFDIASSRVQLYFHAEQSSSQAHRGFLIHYTGPTARHMSTIA